jgi:Protein of unknown function (DUF3147)
VSDLLLRFAAGGVIVCVFAAIGDALKPKIFAGLFGAAPSVALATLGLTMSREGARYAALESRSMIIGAFGFFAYSLCVSYLMSHYRLRCLAISIICIPLWFAISLGALAIFVNR